MVRTDQKYLGDPDSPNFMPESPLIERQRLSPQEERNLKRFCSSVLADVKNSDDTTEQPLEPYMIEAVHTELAAHPNDKHSSSIPHPPAANVPGAPVGSVERAHGKNNKLPSRARKVKEDQRILVQPLEPSHPRATKTKPSLTNADLEALRDIRRKMEVRPKTSAAACIDWTGDETATSSNPSNRTTYSTPFTSAGITPGDTNKSFSEPLPEIEAVEPTLALPEPPEELPMDPDTTAQARFWMAEQLEKRRLESSIKAEPTRPLAEFGPLNPSRVSEHIRPRSRSGSIAASIREYIRPGSIAMRPDSSAGSARSVQTNGSSRSRLRGQWSALKRKVSRSSLRTGHNSVSRSGFDDGDEYILHASDLDLNRPLPALPGLDSYKEKPAHIATLMKSLVSRPRRDTGNVVVTPNGVPRVLSEEEEKEREDALSRAVMEKMSNGSIGSTATSPVGLTVLHPQRSSVDGELGRPTTSASGMGVGAVPLRYSRGPVSAPAPVLEEQEPFTSPTAPALGDHKRGFAQRWGQKLGLRRKSRAVAAA